jgi:hypothetical protein
VASANRLSVSIDQRMLERTVQKTVQQFDAVQVTMIEPGESHVIVSKRIKMAHERASKRRGTKGKKAAHGRIIAWDMARRGHDPFAYPNNVMSDVLLYQQRNILRAQQKAFRTGRNQHKLIKATLLGMAMKLAWFAAERIRNGKLGMNKTRYGKYKKRMQEEGIALQKWGGQWPPYGILTGRFVGDDRSGGSPGIRARHVNPGRGTLNAKRPRREPRDILNR